MSDSNQFEVDGQTFEMPPAQDEQTQEKAISEGYQKIFEQLIYEKGFSPRKARRYLDSVSKKNFKKFSKQMKSRQSTGSIKYVDLETAEQTEPTE